MKSIYQYLKRIGFTAVWCLFVAIPVMAQRGGHSGGGHSTGGYSGGGHSSGSFSRGGGFSGGGRSVAIAPSHLSVASRSAVVRGTSTVLAANGNHRGYVAGSVGTSVYGRGGYYGNYNLGHYGGYFYNRGYYGSLYYPWLGFNFGFLPYGYYSFYWGGYPYYYYDGFYYTYNNEQYTVVEPPIGAAINKLPSGAQSIVINGQQYYEKNGVYYQPITKEDGTIVYQVAGKDGHLNTEASGADTVTPHIGDIVSQLPPECRKVKLNGSIFFVSPDGIYYQEMNNNNVVYKIVGLDDDNNQ